MGGSLFDLPELGPLLQRWLAEQRVASVLLVPGGGAVVDAVRALDCRHALGEEESHWLALRALSVNAYFLAALLPPARVVADPRAASGGVAVLDAHAFARNDEGRPGQLPHSWSATSDALAARAAVVAGVSRLVLLKSVNIPADVDWTEAGQRGWVDPCLAQTIDAGLSVQAVDFRAWSVGIES